MNSNQDNKDKPLPRPILKLNLGANKSLPEAALQKINKLKSQETLLNAEKGIKPVKKKEKAVVPIILKVSETNKNLKIKKVEEVAKIIETKGEDKTPKPLEAKQKSNPKKWPLLHPTKYQKMLKEFRADFPNCFSLERKPLALDIRQALIDIKPDYTPMQIAVFLKIYCRGVLYKEKLVLGAERVSLDGAVQSLVTEEQLAKDRNNILKAESKPDSSLKKDNEI